MRKELYWVANYLDGSQLKQFQDGTEMKYADIDRERLVRFDMLDYSTDKPVYSLYLREDQKLIYRRRTLKRMDGSPDVIIYLVGYQLNILTNSGSRTMIVVNYIHEDGAIALDGARNNLELLDFEF